MRENHGLAHGGFPHAPTDDQADGLFHALAYPMSFAAVQKHVGVLEPGRPGQRERRGRE